MRPSISYLLKHDNCSDTDSDFEHLDRHKQQFKRKEKFHTHDLDSPTSNVDVKETYYEVLRKIMDIPFKIAYTYVLLIFTYKFFATTYDFLYNLKSE